jgi:hypothetical protein
MFLSQWPGEKILLVWGASALDSVRLQTRGKRELPKPQHADYYGIVCTDNKASTVDLQQLYGGEPVLVVNAQKYSYKDMSNLSDTGYEKRLVYTSKDFPYWHHSFHVEALPFGFKNTVDPKALSYFCAFCMLHQKEPCQESLDCHHYVCSNCRPFNYSVCYHSAHKKEYLDILNDSLDLELLLCDGDGCTAHVNPDVGCSECQQGAYCSDECLREHHVCEK